MLEVIKDMASVAISFAIFCCVISGIAVEQKWAKHSRRESFKGKVAGICAGFALAGICSGDYAERICRHALSEYERCCKIKNERPTREDDPIYATSHGNFAEFAILCAIQYAENCAPDSVDTDAALQFCRKNVIHARKLTQWHNFYRNIR